MCCSIYRPSSTQNLKAFLNELTNPQSKANGKYINAIVMGDFNIVIGLSYGDFLTCNF